jgi:hypothetical protein
MSIADRVMPKDTNVKFATDGEPWTAYRFDGGTVLRVRPTLVSVKGRGFHDEKHPLAGFPSFALNIQVQQVAEWTDEVIQAAREFRRKHGLPEMPGEGGF